MNIERFIDKDQALRVKTEIRSVLMREWDPIGVKGEPMAADEYDAYIGGIYELLKNRAATKKIADHLREIEIRRMGFAEFQVPERLDTAASLLHIDLG
jgi:hypothetical protein